MPRFRRSYLVYLATALLATSPVNAEPSTVPSLADRQLAFALQLILGDIHSNTAICLYATRKLPLTTDPSYRSAEDLLAKQGALELLQHPWTPRMLNQAARAAAKLLPKMALRPMHPGRGNGCQTGFLARGHLRRRRPIAHSLARGLLVAAMCKGLTCSTHLRMVWP